MSNLKKMRKIFPALTLLSLLVVPAIAAAAVSEIGDISELEETDVMATMAVIVNYVFTGLIILGVIFIIIAGYFFITAQGDPEKTKTARNFVVYAVIGLIVGFLARGFISLVENITGGY